MKTERRMKAGTRNGPTAVAAAAAMLTIAALSAPRQAMAGTKTVPAPTETASIHLGVKDLPASAYLDGWWCSKTDQVRKDVGKLYRETWDSLNFARQNAINFNDSGNIKTKTADEIRMGLGAEDIAVTFLKWEISYLDKGWPFKLAGLQKSPTKKGLDAPPGGSKVYEFKRCYTADELKTIHDKVVAWMKYIEAQMVNIALDREEQFHGLDGELVVFVTAGH